LKFRDFVDIDILASNSLGAYFILGKIFSCRNFAELLSMKKCLMFLLNMGNIEVPGIFGRIKFYWSMFYWAIFYGRGKNNVSTFASFHRLSPAGTSGKWRQYKLS
jgi:hypothetical protein